MEERYFLTRFPELTTQLIAAILATFGAVSDGMHYGWTSPTLELLNRNGTHIVLTGEDHVWLETIYIIGGICGLPVTIYLVDKIGRKQTILIASIVALISWGLIAIADHVIYLYCARFIVGISGDAAFIAEPMYIAEIADKKIRGFLSGMIYVMMLAGILLIYAVAPYAPFYVPSLIGGGMLVLQLVTFPFMPDSPYHLISKGREQDAKKELKRLRGRENVDEEFSEIIAAVKRQQSESKNPLDLVTSKSNRKALFIMFVLNGAQHFSSISVMLMNLHSILVKADSKYLSSNASGIIFAALMLIAALLADFIVDKFGRKYLLIISSLLSTISLLVLAVYFTLQKNNFDVKLYSWIPVVAVMVYAFVFKLGMGIIPIVMSAELFPANVRAMGMTVSELFYECTAWLSIEMYLRLITYAGYDYPFYIFAICCLFSAIFALFYIPETKGKSLEEIQFILKGIPFPPRSNSIVSENFLEISTKTDIETNDREMELRSRSSGGFAAKFNEKI